MVAGLFDKIARLANSPKGQKAIHKAKQYANKPENRAKLQRLVAKLLNKHGGRRY